MNKIIHERKYSAICIDYDDDDKNTITIEHYNLSKSRYMDKWIILSKEDLNKIYEIINKQGL